MEYRVLQEDELADRIERSQQAFQAVAEAKSLFAELQAARKRKRELESLPDLHGSQIEELEGIESGEVRLQGRLNLLLAPYVEGVSSSEEALSRLARAGERQLIEGALLTYALRRLRADNEIVKIDGQIENQRRIIETKTPFSNESRLAVQVLDQLTRLRSVFIQEHPGRAGLAAGVIERSDGYVFVAADGRPLIGEPVMQMPADAPEQKVDLPAIEIN